MKIKIFNYLIFALLILDSCHTKENKFVQAEFDKIQGTWIIDNFTLPPDAPDSLQNFFKSGVFLFKKCKYNQKEFTKNPAVCGGEAEINQTVVSMYYNYLYDVQQFMWAVNTLEATPKTFKINKAVQLFDGNWEVLINGNKMVAKRKDVIKSYLQPGSFYKGEVMFTATRK
jgi:hypothetical protein